jgi:creatinine amidohydrolase
MSRLLTELSGPAAARALGPGSVVVLPTGAIEHHGPHLPLSTDLVMAEVVAERAVAAAAADGADVWLLPALAYTKSDEHHWAPGTMWLRADTLLDTVVDLGRSVAASGAGKLVFLNAHGGNVALLQVAIREIRRQTGLQTFFASFPVPAGDGASGPDERGLGIHAGHGETSIMLHLRPELVQRELGVRSVPAQFEGFERIGFHSSPAILGWISDDFGTDGTIGDPTEATAEHGAVPVDSAVELMRSTLLEIARFRL